MAQSIQAPPDSKVFTVQELFQKSSPLVVPSWQRDYAWQPDDHVQKLIEDIWSFNEDFNSNLGRYYLLGQVIIVSNPEGKNEIVDGQQRLTTMYLMLLCLHNTFRVQDRVQLHVQKNTIVSSQLISAIIDDDEIMRLSLPYQDGTKVLDHLYKHGSNNRELLGDELTLSQQNLLDVYDHFQSWVDVQLPDEETLTVYTKRLMQMVYFTRLIIGDIPQAMDYFEKMNRRGLPLAASDLLKNYLFSQAEEKEFEELSKMWKKMTNEVERIKKRSVGSTEMFIKTWAVSRHFQKINGTDALLNYWKNELSTDKESEKFKKDLPRMSKFYHGVAEGMIHGDRQRLEVLESVRSLNGSQHLSVLLAGNHLENLEYLCDLVDRRFVLYTFGNERTGAFESMIPKWCAMIAALPSKASEEEILTVSRKAEGFVRSGAKTDVASFLESLNYTKTSNRRKLRFVLATASRHLDKRAKAEHHAQPLSFYLKTARKLTPGFDMDHVLGQQYLVEMKPEEQLSFNSLGALTPLYSSAHREQVHLKPDAKFGLYEQSPFVLTKSLVAIPNTASPRLKSELEALRKAAPVDLSDWTVGSVAMRTTLIISTFIDAINVDDFLAEKSK
jgi:uncharacterized protein with ParB-like and HNH nuclease domain